MGERSGRESAQVIAAKGTETVEGKLRERSPSLAMSYGGFWASLSGDVKQASARKRLCTEKGFLRYRLTFAAFQGSDWLTN